VVSEEPKPCPFCGSQPEIEVGNFGGFNHAVHCESCGTMGIFCRSEEEAIAAWNRRPIEDALNALVDWLRSVVKNEKQPDWREYQDLMRKAGREGELE